MASMLAFGAAPAVGVAAMHKRYYFKNLEAAIDGAPHGYTIVLDGRLWTAPPRTIIFAEVLNPEAW